jgi:hypothetical protein
MLKLFMYYVIVGFWVIDKNKIQELIGFGYFNLGFFT